MLDPIYKVPREIILKEKSTGRSDIRVYLELGAVLSRGRPTVDAFLNRKEFHYKEEIAELQLDKNKLEVLSIDEAKISGLSKRMAESPYWVLAEKAALPELSKKDLAQDFVPRKVMDHESVSRRMLEDLQDYAISKQRSQIIPKRRKAHQDFEIVNERLNFKTDQKR